jgi:hypothetical protein
MLPQAPLQLRGVQIPQTFAVPAPPHVCGDAQLPQSSVPPQPSETLPHVAPRSAQVCGVQHLFW